MSFLGQRRLDEEVPALTRVARTNPELAMDYLATVLFHDFAFAP
jgi:hypothetical protein